MINYISIFINIKILYMTNHKSNYYKLTAIQYYLVEEKTQEEVCKIFKCYW